VRYNNSAIGRGAPAVAVIHMGAQSKKRKLSNGRSRTSLDEVRSASSFSTDQAAQVQEQRAGLGSMHARADAEEQADHACGTIFGCSSTGLSSVSSILSQCHICDLQIQSQLLGWYDKSHRALPWRRNPHTQTAAADDPEHKALLELPQQQMIYRVWISEIMCQQTQVSTTLRAADHQLPPAVCNQQHLSECRWLGHQSTSGAGSSSGLMCNRLLAPHSMRCGGHTSDLSAHRRLL
jgi:hypothetical protein